MMSKRSGTATLLPRSASARSGVAVVACCLLALLAGLAFTPGTGGADPSDDPAVADGPATTAGRPAPSGDEDDDGEAPDAGTTATTAATGQDDPATDAAPAVDDAGRLTISADAIPRASAAFDESVPVARPARVVVETADIDAPIIFAGVTDDGEMELPGAEEAAWYKHGPVPGAAEGSSVIAAHVDWNGRPGPFFDLRTLEPGTEVVVELTDGTSVRYRTVGEPEYRAKDDLPSEEMFRVDGPPALVLVTCGGGFDERTRSYDDNVIVWAEPAG